MIPIVSRSTVPFYGPSIAFTDHSYRLQVICTVFWAIHSFYRSFLSSPGHLYCFTDHPQLLQIIPIVSRSPVPFHRPSIAFTDHSYRLQVTCTVFWAIHSFTDHSYRLQVTCTFSRTIHSFYRSLLLFAGRLYLFTDHPQLLQTIPIVSRSPVPFHGPSIAFADHSYCLQVTCTFLQTIHSFQRSFLLSPGHLYLFADHPQLLQIISIVSRSPVPFHGPSIAFTDDSYRLQINCTFLRTIHSFYRSFLSSLGHLYCFLGHPQLLPIIPIITRSPILFHRPSIAFADHSYRLQVTCTFSQTIHSFYRSFVSSPGHLYCFLGHPQLYRSFLSSPGHLYCFLGHPQLYRSFLSSLGHLYLFTDHPQLLQIIAIVCRSPVPFHGPSIAFTDHSYRVQVTCTFSRTIHSFCRSFLLPPGHLYLFTDYSQLLEVIPIVSRSPVPFRRPSIAFTDHFYRFQVACTFSRTIHSFYR